MSATSMPKMSNLCPSFLSVVSQFARLSGLICSMVCATSVVHAEKADRHEPLHFAADAARVEDKQRINVLTGNVEITKGTMVVRAERVEVRQNPDGSQTATALAGANGRAYFRQKRDGVDEFIEGDADRIVYDGQSESVRFSGRAMMRRLKGRVVVDQVTGPVIIYDNTSSVFQVEGQTPGGNAPAGRVKGIISPRGQDVISPRAVSDGAR